jgi:hypothetical protein
MEQKESRGEEMYDLVMLFPLYPYLRSFYDHCSRLHQRVGGSIIQYGLFSRYHLH